jgi:integrase/recombinase XerD
MKIKVAIDKFRYHQKTNLKQRTIKSYIYLLLRFEAAYADKDVESIRSEEILKFLQILTGNTVKSTRRLRYSQIKTFFNFIIDECSLDIKNPCNSSLLSKSFRIPKQKARKILDKEAVDEMIYSARCLRDRLILELQARCGLRIGELLQLKVSDVSERKLILNEPKSGKESEVAYMPEQISKRLSEYISTKKLSPEQRVFPICYSAARSLIKKLGRKLNLQITPHDLRRHSATYASRNGVPLEIVSKVILRHQDLKTTQMYLGRVSEPEAIRWMDILHGK